MVEWILGRMKKKGENEKEKLFGECLVGGEGKEMMEPGCFLPKRTKMGRKRGGGGGGGL